MILLAERCRVRNTEEEIMSGIVYLLTNPVMDGLVKIGQTENLEARVRGLSGFSGIPVPFEVFYACTVEDASKVESALHDAFDDHRINRKREFFRINPERVISALKLAEIEDVTPSDDMVEDKQEQDSLDRERKRRSNFRFSMADIPEGAELKFVRNEKITATVHDNRNIVFEGKVTSLTQAALDVLERDYAIRRRAVPGPQYWMYEDETLDERRSRMESE